MIHDPHRSAGLPVPEIRNHAPASTFSLSSALRGGRGFTLIELLIVVAIIASLTTVALPAGLNYIEKVRKARCLGDLQILNNEIQAYYIDKNAYPGSLSDIGRDTFLDPWKVPYQYTNIQSGGPPLLGSIDQLNPGNDYDLYSKGPDRQTSTPNFDIDTCADDLVRASDGSYFGFRGDF